MQDPDNNHLREAPLMAAPHAVFQPNGSDLTCFSSSQSCEESNHSPDKLSAMVAGPCDLSDDRLLALIGNDQFGDAGNSVMPEDLWYDATALTNGAVPEPFLDSDYTGEPQPLWNSNFTFQGENSSSMVYRGLPTPLDTPIESLNWPEHVQRSRNPSFSSDSTCDAMTTRQKIAHSQSERRYRQNLEATFSQLEDTVNSSHDGIRKTDHRSSKRVRRREVLAAARRTILDLRSEVNSLTKKLQMLREATVPSETLKFTLMDRSSR